jgi:hypothetical protein
MKFPPPLAPVQACRSRTLVSSLGRMRRCLAYRAGGQEEARLVEETSVDIKRRRCRALRKWGARLGEGGGDRRSGSEKTRANGGRLGGRLGGWLGGRDRGWSANET